MVRTVLFTSSMCMMSDKLGTLPRASYAERVFAGSCSSVGTERLCRPYGCNRSGSISCGIGADKMGASENDALSIHAAIAAFQSYRQQQVFAIEVFLMNLSCS